MLVSKKVFVDRIRQQIIAQSQNADFVVMEAAVGAGVSGLAVAQSLCEGHRMIIVDSNQENLDRLDMRLREGPLNVRSSSVCCDIRHMPMIPDDCANIICCDTTINMLGHEFYMGLREFYRVLRPGGTLHMREVCAPAIEASSTRDVFFKVISSARSLLDDPYVMLPSHLVTFALDAAGFSEITVQQFEDDDEGDDIKEITNWHPLCRDDFAMREAFLTHYRDRVSQLPTTSTPILETYVITCTKLV